MTMQVLPLTGIALATALFAAGLAPPGVFLAGGTYWYPVTIGGKAAWEPWRDIADSWHLVLRYMINIQHCTPGVADHYAQLWPQWSQDLEIVWTPDDFAAAISRLALRLHHPERAQEAAGCPP